MSCQAPGPSGSWQALGFQYQTRWRVHIVTSSAPWIDVDIAGSTADNVQYYELEKRHGWGQGLGIGDQYLAADDVTPRSKTALQVLASLVHAVRPALPATLLV